MTAALIVAPFATLALTLAAILAGIIMSAASPSRTKENHVHPHQ